MLPWPAVTTTELLTRGTTASSVTPCMSTTSRGGFSFTKSSDNRSYGSGAPYHWLLSDSSVEAGSNTSGRLLPPYSNRRASIFLVAAALGCAERRLVAGVGDGMHSRDSSPAR